MSATSKPGRLSNPVVYEIYPRSFQDTTGSGEGDLAGITRRLGYVRDLGVDAIWLAPFYASPMVDGGYDISDHRAVDPRFGTLDDFDALLGKAHEFGLGVIVDLVFNHTSCEHPRFLAALNGDEDAAECYVWRDPKPDGTVPNNWVTFFGETAWTWSHKRRQFYMHQFLNCQPSLDLRHPAVQDDHAKTVAFWKDRGVDGFRMDAITSYLFDADLKDNPPASPEVSAKISGEPFNPYTYQDHLHDMLPGDGASYAEQIRSWAGDDLWLVGENNSGNQSVSLSLDFTRPGRLDAAYTFDTATGGASPGTYAEMLAQMDGSWRLPWWFSSHDHPRGVSALGDGLPGSAKFYALLLGVLPGPLILYQGEELGLPQPDLPKDAVKDPFDLLYWPDGPGRDGARVPLPWTEDPSRGFTDGTPWLPMEWSAGMSAAAQTDDPGSTLEFYRSVLKLRREYGFAQPDSVTAEVDGDTLTLHIASGGDRYRAVFNFGKTARDVVLDDKVLMTNADASGQLQQFQGVIIRGGVR